MHNDIEGLIADAKKKENHLLVIDESSLSFNRYDPTQFWVAKVSRHQGHASIFIGQNMVDVPKGVRSQCTQIFVFASSRDDASELSNQFDNDELLNVTKLKPLQFYRILSSGGVIQRGHIDAKSQKIIISA